MKNCKDCGNSFEISPEQHIYFNKRDLSDPVRCPLCRDKRKHKEYVECVDCGQVFEMNGLEVEFYLSKGYKLPRRCSVCRAQRRGGKS